MSSVVPEGWAEEKLGNVSAIIDPHPSHRAPPEVNGGIPFLGIGDLKENGDIDTSKVRLVAREEILEHEKRYRISENTIGFGRVASIGKIVDFRKEKRDVLISPTLAVIEPHSVQKKYLVNYLKSQLIADQLDFFITGSTRSSLGIQLLRELSILLPPLPEQKKIASILTSVDEVIENTQKQIDKLQDLKKATMNELLTKGIGHTEFKDSELGRIPKSWEVSLIGEVCEVGTGKKDTQNKMKYGKYPFFVRSQTIERIDSYSFDGEAILTAGDGVGTGKVFHYVNGRFDFHQRVYKLSDFRGGALGKFLYYCFSSRFLEQVQQFSARGSVESVRMEMITGMAIPLPSIQEQSKIVDCISAIETNISIGKQKLHQTQSLKKSLMQDLLTGKVRVTVN